MTKAIKKWFILPLLANYTEYPVPQGVFDIELVYLFNSATSYSELKVYDLGYIEESLSPGWRGYPSTPRYAYVGKNQGMNVNLGVAPASKTSATAVTIVTGGYTVTRPFGSVDGIYGSAAPGSATITYVDSEGQNFVTMGLAIGQKIMNITNDLLGTVVSIGTTNTANDTIVTDLTWIPGDEMRILAGDAVGTLAITAQEASYILSAVKGSMPTPGITMAANNLLVCGYSQPVKLVEAYQYPELNPLFHAGIALGAAALLGKEDPADSPEFAQAITYEEDYLKNIGSLSTFMTDQYSQGAQIISRVK
jgi:hypothetical protein